MISYGKRVYSIPEIRRMMDEGYTDDFLQYLSKAPNAVLDIVKLWDSNVESRMKIFNEVSSNVDDFEKTSLEKQNEDNWMDYQEADTSNPYQNLKFKSRINVTKLYLHLCEEEKCPIHDSRLKHIQVMIRISKKSRYSILLNSCHMCKKLYISSDELNEKEIDWRSRKIQYEVS